MVALGSRAAERELMEWDRLLWPFFLPLHFIQFELWIRTFWVYQYNNCLSHGSHLKWNVIKTELFFEKKSHSYSQRRCNCFASSLSIILNAVCLVWQTQQLLKAHKTLITKSISYQIKYNWMYFRFCSSNGKHRENDEEEKRKQIE